MQQIKSEVDFSSYKPFSELNYDTSLATDPSKSDDLIRFVRTYYNEDSDQPGSKYQEMITSAIKVSNLEAIEILWQGIYYHDRDNPDFETDVYTAAEFGNLPTVQHTLYAYKNYNTLNGVEDLDEFKLKNLTSKNPNPDVSEFILKWLTMV